MTAYNVVRFRVKPGMEDAFLSSQRKSLTEPLPGALDGALIKTGERSYCFIGKWDKFESIVAARPTMISFLDEIRPYLEDLGNGRVRKVAGGDRCLLRVELRHHVGGESKRGGQAGDRNDLCPVSHIAPAFHGCISHGTSLPGRA